MQSCAQFCRMPLRHPPSSLPLLSTRTSTALLLCSLHPLCAAATRVKEHPESRSSSLLMVLLSGACLFVSLPMCSSASSCHPLQQGRARLLFYFMFGCLWRAERCGAQFSNNPAVCYDSQFSCHSEPCCKWIWRRQFLWCSSQSVSMRLDDCFYCP